MRNIIKKTFRALGYEIGQFNPQACNEARLKHFLKYYEIDLVLDVGANIGQYSNLLRELGYKNRIVSFEAVSSTHKKLQQVSRNDNFWEIADLCAIGNEEGSITINISGNSVSSSVIPMLDSHRSAAPESAFYDVETVPLRRLDTIAKDYLQDIGPSVFLKIDVQGFEKQVLEGATGILPWVKGIELELSIIPLYQDQLLYGEIIQYLDELGYELYAFIPDFSDSVTGRMLQMDGIFLKK